MPTFSYDTHIGMPVEINSELRPGDPTLEIPWSSPNQPRLKYIDLSRLPGRIASLAECKRNPPMARLLRRLNRHGSIFRTAKCDVWDTTKLEEDEKLDFELPARAGGYVDMVFEQRDYQSRLAPHLRLAKELEKSLAHCRLLAQTNIVVRRCLFHENGKWGYSMTIFVYAYGATKSDARREWGRALDSLGAALQSTAVALVKKRTKPLDRRTDGAI
jgi:hypothetical protein